MKNNLVNLVEQKDKAASKKYFIIWLLILLALSFISIFIFSLCFSHSHRIFSASLMLGMACCMSGTFLGFLFGIPKINENHDGIKKSRYKLNSNLTEISDWLTKIIIGLGLVEFRDIRTALWAFSLRFAKYVSCSEMCPDSLTVFALSCMFSFLCSASTLATIT